MEVRRWKVFLDISALIAGIVSTTGAAREHKDAPILAAAISGES
jgi:hypothetical protein